MMINLMGVYIDIHCFYGNMRSKRIQDPTIDG